MLSGDFQRKLRKLNRDLRIYYGNSHASWPAGIFHVVKGEYTEICGIDKNYVPEHSIFTPHGAHLKGGWRRALKILIKKGLIDRRKAEKVFRTRLHYQSPSRYKQQRDNALGAQRLG